MTGLPKISESDRLHADNERLHGALDELLHAFQGMPDAGLSSDDPRYAWWYQTAEARKRAREALGRA